MLTNRKLVKRTNVRIPAIKRKDCKRKVKEFDPMYRFKNSSHPRLTRQVAIKEFFMKEHCEQNSQKLLHLDLKPANVLVRMPKRETVFIDFGIARLCLA